MNRPARVDAYGLVVPPSLRDCVGEACAVRRELGSCFADDDHLYWPKRRFIEDPLAWEFRMRPENIIRIARCRHNMKHDRFTHARMPRPDIMHEFIRESLLLQSLGVTANNLDVKLAVYESGLPNDVARLEDEIARLHQDLLYLSREAGNLTFLSTRVELVPLRPQEA